MYVLDWLKDFMISVQWQAGDIGNLFNLLLIKAGGLFVESNWLGLKDFMISVQWQAGDAGNLCNLLLIKARGLLVKSNWLIGLSLLELAFVWYFCHYYYGVSHRLQCTALHSQQLLL